MNAAQTLLNFWLFRANPLHSYKSSMANHGTPKKPRFNNRLAKKADAKMRYYKAFENNT